MKNIELIKKLNHFNIYANLGFQFDGIDKFEKYSIAYHNKLKTIGIILLQI